MKFSLPLILISVLILSSFNSTAQVTQLSDNSNIETAFPLGSLAVLISSSDSLWRTDGTPAGTFKYANHVAVGVPYGNAIFLNKLYFNGTDANGQELWVTDGTPGGTQLVKNINPGAASSTPQELIAYNNSLYFFADDGTNGAELWKSDGTTGGTAILKDIHPGAGSSFSFSTFFTVFNNTLFFIATDGVNGNELWKTDGTPGGTVMVKDINPGPGSSDPVGFMPYGSIMLFSADDGSTGKELWKTDGTTGGTALVKDITAGPFGSSPSGFTLFNNKIYFTALNFLYGFEGYVTDGTTANTELLKDIDPGPPSGFPLFMNSFFANNKMIFTAFTTAEGGELWSSDGTGVNTSIFKDINAGEEGSDPIFFLNFFSATDYITYHSNTFNGAIFLQAKNAAAGTELWKSDGTPSGTVMVKDINPGADSSMTIDSVTYFYTSSNFYFSATDGLTGYELWKSDGTAANTNRVFDINPGDGSATPQFLTYFNGIVLFTATDGDNTDNLRDLFRLDGTFSPLPLNLLQFTGSVYDKSVHLKWSTSSEVNTAYFNVERSTNAVSYESIGKVNAVKNNSDRKDYLFDDINVLNAAGGKLFYRLKMVDNDGKFNYSRVIAVNRLQKGGLVIYPNPVTNVLAVTINSTERKQVALKIYDQGGRLMYQQQLNLIPGVNSYPVNTASFTNGYYYINLVTQDGIEAAGFIKN